MDYPLDCFTNLVGVRGLCEDAPTTPFYWLDDIPGIDLSNLAKVATSASPTGADLARNLVASAGRILMADVEAIYDANYKVQNTLVAGCSICTLLNTYLAGSERGILVKDNTHSSFSTLVIEKLTTKVNVTGTFNVVIDDGLASNLRIFPVDLEAGVPQEVVLIGYTTKQKQVRIYMEDATVPLAQLSCPTGSSGCGCSGRSRTVSTDLVYTGTFNGAETQQAYGFIPCAFIRCDAADLLCYVAKSAPRMMGLALLYKTAELYFQTVRASTRNNKVAGTTKPESADDSKLYGTRYQDKLTGKGTRGVKDLVFTTLQQTNDSCVVCNALMATAWAGT